MFKVLRFLLFVVATFSVNLVFSQLPYEENFKNATAPGIKFGGGDNPATEGYAFLTANNATGSWNTMPIPDANGDGYLRLTNNLTYQKGYIYNETIRIPSTNGLRIEFEYYTYSPPGTLAPRGADGICFFLFDASVLPNFKIGGFGGSLGYAQYKKDDLLTGPVHAAGVTGGYIGVGFDEYGYFARDEEGRQPQVGAGKQPSPQKGAVGIRGKGNGDALVPGNYPLLTFKRTDELSTPFSLVGGNGNSRQPNPSNIGYRKAVIILEPSTNGGYFISVDILLGGETIPRKVIDRFHYKELAPEILGYGISSSTGNNVNIHEIRNLKISLYDDKPVGISDEANTLTNVPVNIPVKDNDLSKTNTIVIRNTEPANGTYTIINSDTGVNYVPNPGFSGTDTFTYKLYDTVTGKESNPITVTVHVKPVGSPDTYTTPLNTPLAVNVKDNDASKSGTTVIPNTNPVNGIISIDPVTNIVTYTPNNNFVGSDSFTYKLRTPDGLESDPINVTINVLPNNLTPAKIGLAKALIGVDKQIDGSFMLTYRFTLVNAGQIAIADLSLTDDLLSVFTDADFSVKSIKTDGTSLVPNLAYDGRTDKELLNVSSMLLPLSKEHVNIEVLVALNKSKGTYDNTAYVKGKSQGDGTVVDDESTDGLTPDPIVIGDFSPNKKTPVTLEKGSVFIPEGFSPNNDGINDRFIIQNTSGKELHLEIYNRWGNVIYKSKNYQNDWDGKCNQGIYFGEDVPSGTYYYIISIEGDRKVGFITISR
ncbi:hypothetical protein Pedsa_1037 [Pseudopedobacter saltans DSM 12145]|uniref:Uncharacterized protein n=1 Tax=Pseudopedobacter saltans (strain ATCC 51119 / DSM 12145 / JCM 21818 / CCUG 39354 / LMG 10337 / NBRC 100064 / NCIMB 13643) TaxID=762903 RepID=F0SBG2_PSESL|nr:gliding motility-associated C-terminal domain-containing protein [Pseudopedobacter saltans]ADY51608.1 hypothetical protein Pedsa_1037 [Pseudopedobacter saltans DSM 12145]